VKLESSVVFSLDCLLLTFGSLLHCCGIQACVCVCAEAACAQFNVSTVYDLHLDGCCCCSVCVQ